MKKMIEQFPEQLFTEVEICEKSKISIKNVGKLQNVLITGMGGSGIGGNFVAELVKNNCRLPVFVNKSYDIPAFVNNKTLAIVSSYSGNTEETINAFNQLKEKGAEIVIVSSGGKLIDTAKEENINTIAIPDGWSSPRACLGFSVVAQLCVLIKAGIISGDYFDEIIKTGELLLNERDDIRSIAKAFADTLFDKLPVIYAPDNIEPVAVRMRQQLNENAKMLAWHHVLPEMNHNELVGWKEDNKDIVAVFIRSQFEHNRTTRRIEITKEIISKKANNLIEITAKGETSFAEMMYLTNIIDWTSYYLSKKRNVDVIEIEVIDFLKSELSNL